MKFITQFFQIKKEERLLVILSFAAAMVMFASYSLLRPVREALGADSGVDKLPYLFWVTFTVMLFLQPLYGFAISRISRAKLLPAVYVAVSGMLVGFFCWFENASNMQLPAQSFFVWISVINLFIISMFWSLMADIFDKEQASRLFGFIVGGISAGGLLGPALAAFFAKLVGTLALTLVGAGLLLLATALVMAILYVYRNLDIHKATQDEETKSKDKIKMNPLGNKMFEAFTTVWNSQYLRYICLFVILTNFVSTFLYLEQHRIIADNVMGRDERTQIFALLDFIVQGASITIQFVLFSFIFKRLGMKVVLSFMPIILGIAFIIILADPSLIAVLVAMSIRRIGQYSLVKPARDMLFTVTTAKEKYLSKTLIDTLVYRSGDAISGSLFAGLSGLGVYFLGAHILTPLGGFIFCAIWLWSAIKVGTIFRSKQ